MRVNLNKSTLARARAADGHAADIMMSERGPPTRSCACAYIPYPVRTVCVYNKQLRSTDYYLGLLSAMRSSLHAADATVRDARPPSTPQARAPRTAERPSAPVPPDMTMPMKALDVYDRDTWREAFEKRYSPHLNPRDEPCTLFCVMTLQLVAFLFLLLIQIRPRELLGSIPGDAVRSKIFDKWWERPIW